MIFLIDFLTPSLLCLQLFVRQLGIFLTPPICADVMYGSPLCSAAWREREMRGRFQTICNGGWMQRRAESKTGTSSPSSVANCFQIHTPPPPPVRRHACALGGAHRTCKPTACSATAIPLNSIRVKGLDLWFGRLQTF